MLWNRNDNANHRHRPANGSGVVLTGILAGTMTLGLVGCSTKTDTSATTSSVTDEDGTETATASSAVALRTAEEIPADGSPLTLIDATDMWSDRDQDGSYDAATAIPVKLGGNTSSTDTGSGNISVSDKAVTISEGGVYVLSGSTDDLGIVIDAPDDAKVQVVLNGATIKRNGYAGIYAKSADKVFLTVADGTENSVTSSGEFIQQDDNTVDGAVFSKCDMTINGNGHLSVSSDSGHGIVCKDDLRLVSSETSVNASKHAIQAKDSVAIHGGTWTLVGGKDGIHSENSDDPKMGWFYADGGSLAIESGKDGIDSGSWLQIDEGAVSVKAGDDGIHSELDLAVNGGTVNIMESNEGIEGGTVTVTSGDVSIVASDDGVNATGDPTKATVSTEMQDAGQQPPADMPNGQPRDATANEADSTTPNDGNADASEKGASDITTNASAPTGMPGGAEGEGKPNPPQDLQGQGEEEPPTPPDGQDGFPVSQGGEAPDGTTPPAIPEDGQGSQTTADGMGQKRRPQDFHAGGGGGMMDVNDTAILTISGGHVIVDASGDGLDCNGMIHITGGETYVTGPSNDGNTAIDYGTELRIDGGTIVATGSSGMVESVSDKSEQASMTVFLDSPETGSVTVTGNDFDAIEHAPTREYSSVLVSSPAISPDGAYDLATGDTSQIIQMDGTVTTVGSSPMRTGDRGHGMQQGGFARPEDLVGQRLIDDGGNATDAGTEAIQSATSGN